MRALTAGSFGSRRPVTGSTASGLGPTTLVPVGAVASAAAMVDGFDMSGRGERCDPRGVDEM